MQIAKLQKLTDEVQKFSAALAKHDLRKPTWWTEVDRQGQRVARLLSPGQRAKRGAGQGFGHSLEGLPFPSQRAVSRSWSDCRSRWCFC